jgi:hypothetical protein
LISGDSQDSKEISLIGIFIEDFQKSVQPESVTVRAGREGGREGGRRGYRENNRDSCCSVAGTVLRPTRRQELTIITKANCLRFNWSGSVLRMISTSDKRRALF